MQEDDAEARNLSVRQVLRALAPRLALVAIGVLALTGGCDRGAGPEQDGVPPSVRSTLVGASSRTLAAQAAQAHAPGDAERGKGLVRQFECNRCHIPDPDGGDHAGRDTSCAGCHEWILDGGHGKEGGLVNPTAVRGWQEHLQTMKHLPPLAAGHYRREWVERFLVEPYDLRPNLPATMPRLKITKEQARDIAAHIGKPAEAAVSDGGVADGGGGNLLEGADLTRGEELFVEKGCGTCHVFTAASPPTARLAAGKDPPPVIALAPDLRHARDRFDVSTLVTWLMVPNSIKRYRSQMPKMPVTAEEARHLVAYVVFTDLAPPEVRSIPARLPPLGRRVGYDEVASKVLQKTCRHCHAEPDEALGEGGPGNTGGFGFAPRGLVLSEFEGVAAGSINDQGERRSVFSKTSDGTSLLVRALLARQAEEAGRPDPEVRGMPLGLPSLTPEQIQLVEAWVADGHPR